MWTDENRSLYGRSKLRYSGDPTDEEWALVEPLIPPAKRGGGKRTVAKREVVNGVMHILSPPAANRGLFPKTSRRAPRSMAISTFGIGMKRSNASIMLYRSGVTGGTRGIGHAISVELNNLGYSVAANYGGNDEAARKFHAETRIPVFKWDVGDYEACVTGLKQVESELGPISIIVNNAGITRDAMLHRMTPQQWKDVIRVDLDSVFNMLQPVINGMRDRGFGRIINISSVNGQKGQIGQSNYCAAKAGVTGFTKALAQENARKGITVNCVAPGYIETDMVAAVPEKVLESIIAQIPVGRLGKPEEIAKCVAFLASDHAGFITGATISANGGQFTAG